MTAQPAPGSGPPRRRNPSTILHFVDRTLADKERTANAKELLTSASAAIARIVLSVGLVLALATLLAHDVRISWVIGAAAGAAGVAWRARRRRPRCRPGNPDGPPP